MKLAIASGLVIVLSGSLSAADPADLKPAAAKAAYIRYLAEVSKAQKECQDRVAKARKQFVTELDAVKVTLTKGGQLDDAIAVRDVIEAIETQTDPDALRTQLADTTWIWPDGGVSRPWFSLNADGTVTAGWHGKPGLWTVSPDGTVKMIVSSSGDIHEVRFNSKLTEGVDPRREEKFVRVK